MEQKPEPIRWSISVTIDEIEARDLLAGNDPIVAGRVRGELLRLIRKSPLAFTPELIAALKEHDVGVQRARDDLRMLEETGKWPK